MELNTYVHPSRRKGGIITEMREVRIYLVWQSGPAFSAMGGGVLQCAVADGGDAVKCVHRSADYIFQAGNVLIDLQGGSASIA